MIRRLLHAAVGTAVMVLAVQCDVGPAQAFAAGAMGAACLLYSLEGLI